MDGIEDGWDFGLLDMVGTIVLGSIEGMDGMNVGGSVSQIITVVDGKASESK